MPYDPNSQTMIDFAAARATYQGALSAGQLSGGFADGRPAPPLYDAAHAERSCFAYASWYSQLGESKAVYTAGGHLPPVPPALA